MKGRKPTPASLKLLNGNPGRRPVNEEPESPRIEADDPPPTWLHEDAQAFYRDVVQILSDMGIATVADRLAIIGLAQALAEVKIAHEAMNKFGRVIKDKSGGAQRNPYAVLSAQFLAFVRQFITEFGMTPCSRARLTAKAAGEEDPFDAFLKKSG